MKNELVLRNRQSVRPVDLRQLRKLIEALLAEFPDAVPYELGVQLVGAEEITTLNESFLQHAGPTDVITFDYSADPDVKGLSGEIFICVDEAASQARQFRTTWQSELARYVVHGVLHLRGFDDQDGASRRRMKLEETRLLKSLARRFPLSKLRRPSRLTP